MMLYGVVFIFGACLGSFYHVLGYRMPKGENWIYERSHCSNCYEVLGPYELIPLISYGVQKGRCVTCKAVIKPLYFGVEVVSGLLFLLPVVVYGVEAEALGHIVLAWVFLSLLVVISVSDIYYQVILDRVLLFFSGVLVLIVVSYPQFSVMSHFVGAVVGFLMMSGVAFFGRMLFKREVLGGGDVKLYVLVGWVLGGLPTVLSLFFASFVAILYVVFFVREKSRMIPFGPFIALGAYFCLFYGEALCESYLKILGG